MSDVCQEIRDSQDIVLCLQSENDNLKNENFHLAKENTRLHKKLTAILWMVETSGTENDDKAKRQSLYWNINGQDVENNE